MAFLSWHCISDLLREADPIAISARKPSEVGELFKANVELRPDQYHGICVLQNPKQKRNASKIILKISIWQRSNPKKPRRLRHLMSTFLATATRSRGNFESQSPAQQKQMLLHCAGTGNCDASGRSAIPHLRADVRPWASTLIAAESKCSDLVHFESQLVHSRPTTTRDLFRLRGGGSAHSERPPITVSLSGSGLQHVRMQYSESDFTFVIGNRLHQCCSSFAEFLSPLVFELHPTDPTADELRLEFEDPQDLFLKLISACRGENGSIERRDLTAFLSLCAAVGNREVCASTWSKTGEEITIGNVVNRTLFLAKHHCDIGRELEFLATHFCDVPNSLKSLPVGVIYEAISHESLRLLSEDSLCDLIVEYATVNPEFLCLLEVVRFEFCSCEAISQVLELMCHCMNLSMWTGLCRRLICTISGRFRTQKFVPRSDPLDGIIAHMTKEFGGNLHDLDLVIVTSSDAYSTSWWPESRSTGKNVLDLKAVSSF
jgi:hypothetical protein